MKVFFGTKEYINSVVNNLNVKIINNEYGKPVVKNNSLYFNKSHTHDLSTLIIDNWQCGIDIEIIRKYDDIMAKKMCSDSEYFYLQQSDQKDYDYTVLWVLKESYLKCLGIGLSYSLKKLNFVNDNKIMERINDFSLTIIYFENYIISICRKD